MERGVDFNGDSDKAPRHIIEERKCRSPSLRDSFEVFAMGSLNRK
jgi:hypothetical protein